MVDPPPYKASGWLGIITAGALWSPLFDAGSLDTGIQLLMKQIRLAMPESGAAVSTAEPTMEEQDGELFTVDEMRSEVSAGCSWRQCFVFCVLCFVFCVFTLRSGTARSAEGRPRGGEHHQETETGGPDRPLRAAGRCARRHCISPVRTVTQQRDTNLHRLQACRSCPSGCVSRPRCGS